MESLFEGHSLNDDTVRSVLFAANHLQQRKGRLVTTVRQGRILRRTAIGFLEKWKIYGMPTEAFHRLRSENSNVLTYFDFTSHSVLDNVIKQVPSSNDTYNLNNSNSFCNSFNVDSDNRLSNEIECNTSFLDEERSPEADLQDDPLATNCSGKEDEDEFVSTKVIHLDKDLNGKFITFKRILQHWAVSTRVKHSHLTYLLKLLKHYAPDPLYESLPSSGQQLLKLDFTDAMWCSDTIESSHTQSSVLTVEEEAITACADEVSLSNVVNARKRKRDPKPLPPAIKLSNGGKLMYFGIESALLGNSPGNLFKHADLLQFVQIYKEDPALLPQSLVSKIEDLDDEIRMEKSRKTLKGELTHLNSCTNGTNVPHFQVDVNIDGVWLFNNSEQGELIPILMTVYSVAKSHDAKDIRRIDPSHPVVVGYFHGKHKPDLREFLKLFIEELDRLKPSQRDAVIVLKRQLTVSLRCVRTDGPMRSYLKMCKSHAGYWACERCIQPGTQCVVKKKRKINNEQGKEAENGNKKTIQLRELNAPPRINDKYFTYYKTEESNDDHLPNPNERSPFGDINFNMVSGFIIDPMHTVYAGGLRRKLEGFVFVKEEGKLSKILLAKIDRRLKLFEQCCPIEFDRFVRSLTQCVRKYKDHELRQMLYYLLFAVFSDILQDDHLKHVLLLQQAMLLLGAFNPDPVPSDDISEASRLLKLYVQKQLDFGFPVRFTTHCLIHLPEDVATYKCGTECLSAFVYEDFQRFFRDILVSGNKPSEQIRNRLMERSKYCLPTTRDGLLITTSQEFQKEAENFKLKQSNCTANFVLQFVDKGDCFAKTLRFSNFTITNKFPNNVCLMKNGSVIVCNDIVEFPIGSKEYIISGSKFNMLENIYSTPFPSSKYHIHIASKMGSSIGDWNVNGIRGKMYTLPYKYNENSVPSLLPDITNTSHKWIVSPLFHTLY